MSKAPRWSEEQLKSHLEAQERATKARSVASDGQRRGNASRALGRLKPGAMNKTEAEYNEHLTTLGAAGVIAWHKFEGLKLRLADNTFYTPDFAVMLTDGQMECHEVKGHWEDDARVKIKVAAEMYPFRFLAVKKRAKKDGGGFSYESFE